MGSYSYMVGHGFKSLWLNRLMSFASIVILTACLVITGGAGLLTISIRSVLGEIEGQNQMAVYVEMDASEDEIAILRAQISAIDEVASFEYFSKEEVFQQQLDKLGGDSSLFDGLDPSEVFPATFSVTLKDIGDTARVSDMIAEFDSVYGINAAEQVADTLTGVEKVFLIVGAIIVGILLVASILVIGNTVKLSVFARRKEINIMKYVGATNRYMRLPFVIEGELIGLFSGAASFFILWAVYDSVYDMLLSSNVPWVREMTSGFISFDNIWYYVLVGFVLVGIIIGGMSSSFSVRRHARV